MASTLGLELHARCLSVYGEHTFQPPASITYSAGRPSLPLVAYARLSVTRVNTLSCRAACLLVPVTRSVLLVSQNTEHIGDMSNVTSGDRNSGSSGRYKW